MTQANLTDMLDLIELDTGVDGYQWLMDNADVDRRIDKDVMVGMIVREAGPLMQVYSEVKAFENNWRLWFRANRLVFSHLCDTLDYEYSPLENYDWKEAGSKVNNSTRLSDMENKTGQVSDKSYVDSQSGDSMRFTDMDDSKERTYKEGISSDNVETHNLQLDNTHSDNDVTSSFNENVRDLTLNNTHDDDTSTDKNITETHNLQLANEHEDTTEEKVSAYNEDLYQPDKITTVEGTYTNKDTGTLSTVEHDDVHNEGKYKNTDKGTITDDFIENKDNSGQWQNKDTGTLEDEFTKDTEQKEQTVTKNTKGDISTDARVLVHTQADNTIDSHSITSNDDISRETGNYEKFVLGSTGVYTKQQLIDQERSIAKFNIYTYIARQYTKENCYRVY